MAVTSATSSSLSTTQLDMQQLRVQQAKQNAERAESAARSLRSQANAAQREASQAQSNARSLYVRSDQAQSAAGQARQGVAAIQSQGEMQVRLSSTVDQVVDRASVTAAYETTAGVSEPVVPTQAAASVAPPSTVSTVESNGANLLNAVSSVVAQRASAPVVNTSGQLTGTVVNTTA